MKQQDLLTGARLSMEAARIRELIAAGTWPNGWDGDEVRAETALDAIYQDGAVQPLLI